MTPLRASTNKHPHNLPSFWRRWPRWLDAYFDHRSGPVSTGRRPQTRRSLAGRVALEELERRETVSDTLWSLALPVTSASRLVAPTESASRSAVAPAPPAGAPPGALGVRATADRLPVRPHEALWPGAPLEARGAAAGPIDSNQSLSLATLGLDDWTDAFRAAPERPTHSGGAGLPDASPSTRNADADTSSTRAPTNDIPAAGADRADAAAGSLAAPGVGLPVLPASPTTPPVSPPDTTSAANSLPAGAVTGGDGGQDGPLTHGARTLGLIRASHLQATDQTLFQFTNTTTLPFTHVTFKGQGYLGALRGVVVTKTLPDIRPNSTLTYQPDDPTNVVSPFNPRVCYLANGFAGNADYILEATWNGQRISAAFSPDRNAFGRFVGFLGDGHDGHLMTNHWLNTTVVSTIQPGTAPVLPVIGTQNVDAPDIVPEDSCPCSNTTPVAGDPNLTAPDMPSEFSD